MILEAALSEKSEDCGMVKEGITVVKSGGY